MFRRLSPVLALLVAAGACTEARTEPVAAPAPVETVTVEVTPEPAPTVTVIERVEVSPEPTAEPQQAQPEEPVYVAPDRATVAQFVKGVFRERLERDPDQAELEWHIDWYVAEDREGGDTDARWLEMFDREYAGEMQLVEDRHRQRERVERQQECRDRYYEQHGEPAPGYMCMS